MIRLSYDMRTYMPEIVDRPDYTETTATYDVDGGTLTIHRLIIDADWIYGFRLAWQGPPGEGTASRHRILEDGVATNDEVIALYMLHGWVGKDEDMHTLVVSFTGGDTPKHGVVRWPEAEYRVVHYYGADDAHNPDRPVFEPYVQPGHPEPEDLPVYVFDHPQE